jgi:hypothetical protein
MTFHVCSPRAEPRPQPLATFEVRNVRAQNSKHIMHKYENKRDISQKLLRKKPVKL